MFDDADKVAAALQRAFHVMLQHGGPNLASFERTPDRKEVSDALVLAFKTAKNVSAKDRKFILDQIRSYLKDSRMHAKRIERLVSGGRSLGHAGDSALDELYKARGIRDDLDFVRGKIAKMKGSPKKKVAEAVQKLYPGDEIQIEGWTLPIYSSSVGAGYKDKTLVLRVKEVLLANTGGNKGQPEAYLAKGIKGTKMMWKVPISLSGTMHAGFGKGAKRFDILKVKVVKRAPKTEATRPLGMVVSELRSVVEGKTEDPYKVAFEVAEKLKQTRVSRRKAMDAVAAAVLKRCPSAPMHRQMDAAELAMNRTFPLGSR